MNLTLDEAQQALVASFADLLAKHSSPERVRAAEPSGFDPALWTALREVGVVEMAVPDDRGGWGASLLDLALVAEQVGAEVAPALVVETQGAARLLAALPLDR
nr:acyl-CoA dehydrogenase family protein [Micromonospora sp. DSM 115978]